MRLPSVRREARAGGALVRSRFRRTPLQPRMRAMPVVVALELEELHLHVDGRPEERAVQALPSNRTNQAFDEWMRERRVRHRLDLFHLEDTQVCLPSPDWGPSGTASSSLWMRTADDISAWSALDGSAGALRFQDDRDTGQPPRAHEQRTDAGDHAITETEPWRTLPGAIENQQLLLDEHGFGHDGTHAVSVAPCASSSLRARGG
jgi:hypothetical protein